MKKALPRWHWQDGAVDHQEEHIELATWAADRGAGFFVKPDAGASRAWQGQHLGYRPALRACGREHFPPGRGLLPRGPCARPRAHGCHPRDRLDLDEENQNPGRLHRPRHQVHDAVRDAEPRAGVLRPGAADMTQAYKRAFGGYVEWVYSILYPNQESVESIIRPFIISH